ncbi:FAD-binding protein [Janibacter melonis]|uniref:D-arabinono-1,4-lactone oxidase n=1 Tax=Janibacter melonis TaxID=262209 RepID=UPI002042E11A|nr:D-arabinono-1,4-lactone oxidase [Janibacter melonis]MCM3556458.1 FAD-binding protein [Janibacter melonis]
MTWQNWAGTERADPARVVSPSSTQEVCDAVRAAVRDGLGVKAVGAGHSFSGAAVAPGVQLLPDRLDAVHEVDRASGLVRVGAGMPLHRLTPLLAEHGLALEIIGDIDRQTVGGAVSTGTHGSGERFGSISTQVRALELVLGDGSVVTCSPMEQLLEEVDELAATNDHFELFWFPHTSTALTRRFERLPGDAPLRPMSTLARLLDDEIATNVGLEALLRVGTRVPRLVPGITSLVTRAISARDFTDLAPQVFASRRDVRFREGEYFVPRDALVPALRELWRWVEEHDEPVSFPFEIRFVRSDDIWLSPAHERESAVVAFHQYHRMPHERWFSVCEDVLGAAGGRPHWGKMHRLDASALRPLYPRFDDALAVRDEVDPGRVFANPYLERVLGP